MALPLGSSFSEGRLQRNSYFGSASRVVTSVFGRFLVTVPSPLSMPGELGEPSSPRDIERKTCFLTIRWQMRRQYQKKQCVFKLRSSVMTSYTRAPPKIDGENVFERVFMVASDGNQNVELWCDLGGRVLGFCPRYLHPSRLKSF